MWIDGSLHPAETTVVLVLVVGEEEEEGEREREVMAQTPPGCASRLEAVSV
jgi:hypothetical protein